MLHIVGGVPRAGKSLLAQCMLDERKVGYFPTDILMMGLAKAMPELGLKPSDPVRMRAPIMRPILHGMAVAILENGENYLLEGDSPDGSNAPNTSWPTLTAPPIPPIFLPRSRKRLHTCETDRSGHLV